MVDSVDEPPLRGFNKWAKKLLPTQKSPEKEKQIPSSVLRQHADDTDPVRGRTTHTDTSHGNIQDTQPEGTPVVDKKGDGAQSAPMTSENEGDSPSKAPVHKRFIRDAKRIITASWINWLLVFVPVGIILGAVEDWAGIRFVSPSVIFAINAVAIIPLASLLAFATESVAMRLGDSWGALLNVTFGNAVEIIIFIFGLTANEVRIVQAAALGSILSNLLLILGMAFVLGGLRYREQLFNSSVSQISAALLCLSVVALLLPTAFHAAFADDEKANNSVLKVSRGTSVVLLLVYILYLIFQLKSHAYMYASTPQHLIDEEAHPGVLARILDSSSSSSDDSSSTDSDSTAGSHKTANRIKRALRRKRRKSSSSTKVDSLPSISRNETNSDTLVHSTRSVDEAICSGDEADNEIRRGRHSPSIQTRDFENESVKEKRKKKSKKSKKSHPEKRPRTPEVQTTEKHVSQLQVGFAEKVEEIPDASPRQHHARNLSSAIKPVLNSTNFPHHEATTRSLVPPGLRPLDRTVSGSMRRASSMPDINRQRSPFIRTASPRPSSLAVNVDLESQIVETVDPEQTHLSTVSAIVMLLITTGLVALCAEFLVGSIDYLVSTSGVSQAFIGLIILPVIGNAAEHVTAVTVAYKNKMDLSINIALGSSIQIALFVTPLMVMLGWAIGVEMSLYFSLFETVALFASAFVVNYLMIDGRSNWLEGTLLIAAYVIIAISAFFIPTCGLSDTNGLTDTAGSC